MWVATRGITTAPDRVLVCGGAQQALTAVLSAHCEPGDVVLTESLTYPGFLAAARLLRLRVVGVSMDREGLLPDALALACKTHRPKVLLATPTLQNPTGTVMPLARRRRIASVLRDRALVRQVVLVVRHRHLVPGSGDLARPWIVVQLRILVACDVERGVVDDREVGVVERTPRVLDFFFVAACAEQERSAENDTVTARHGWSPSE